jgi:hypothetical protein
MKTLLLKKEEVSRLLAMKVPHRPAIMPMGWPTLPG